MKKYNKILILAVFCCSFSIPVFAFFSSQLFLPKPDQVLPLPQFRLNLADVIRVRNRPAGDAGDDNKFTFMFSEENVARMLTKLDGTPITIEEVAELYGTEDGMKILTDDGKIDIAVKYNLKPRGVNLVKGWPDVKVTPGDLAIDPQQGRFILKIPSYIDLIHEGDVPMPSYGTAVHVVGNYAYVMDYKTGLHVVNLTTREDEWSYPVEMANMVQVVSRYAYLLGRNSLYILDITDPLNPKRPDKVVGKLDFSGTGMALAVRGDYIYISAGEGGLFTVKIHDEDNPQLINPHIINNYSAGKKFFGMVASGNNIYITDSNKGLKIISLSNPAKPELVGSLSDLGSTVWLDVVGKYAYIVTQDGWLRIVDISNNTDPKSLGKIKIGPQALSIKAVGNYVFITTGRGGNIKVVDVSDPNSPTLVSNNHTIDAMGKAYDLQFEGEYLYVINNDESGLQIFNAKFDSNPVSELITVNYNYKNP